MGSRSKQARHAGAREDSRQAKEHFQTRPKAKRVVANHFCLDSPRLGQ